VDGVVVDDEVEDAGTETVDVANSKAPSEVVANFGAARLLQQVPLSVAGRQQ
jgi:hypothetical protein